jgi:hypothetical protein
MSGPADHAADNRGTKQLALGHEAKVPRERRQQDHHVQIARVVGGQDSRARPREMDGAFDPDIAAGERKDYPAPSLPLDRLPAVGAWGPNP